MRYLKYILMLVVGIPFMVVTGVVMTNINNLYSGSNRRTGIDIVGVPRRAPIDQFSTLYRGRIYVFDSREVLILIATVGVVLLVGSLSSWSVTRWTAFTSAAIYAMWQGAASFINAGRENIGSPYVVPDALNRNFGEADALLVVLAVITYFAARHRRSYANERQANNAKYSAVRSPIR
jgi:hypothetical protein